MTADSPHVGRERMDVSSGFRLVLGPPAALEDAFLAAVAAARERAPLAPVDVLVGGVLQRPYLQRLIADTSPGLLSVRFSTLGELGVASGRAGARRVETQTAASDCRARVHGRGSSRLRGLLRPGRVDAGFRGGRSSIASVAILSAFANSGNEKAPFPGLT